MQLFYPLAKPSGSIGVHRYHDTTKNQSYIPITGCVLSHILSSKELSSLEKMYYVLADGLSCINFSKGRNRSISLPAKSWARRLSCSKSEVFVLQKSLEDKGYFIIYRDKNNKGQNKRNTITTTIPDKVFNDLKYEPDRFDLCDINDECTDHNASAKLDSIDDIFIANLEGKRQHLEKTKMFIRVPYEFLKQLNSSCSISATAKTVILFLFTKIYKSLLSSKNNKLHTESYINANCDSNDEYSDVCSHDHFLTHNPYSSVTNSIVTSYQELQKELKLHRNSISKALKDLEDNNLISKKRFFIKDSEDYNSRANKSLWHISLLNLSLINNNNLKKHEEQAEHKSQNQQIVISEQNKVEYNNNKALESSKEWGCTKYDPPCTDSGQLYIKDSLLKNKYFKDIDYIDANCKNLPVSSSSGLSASEENLKEEFFEDKLCLSSSESYNNSSFLNSSFADSDNSQQKHREVSNIKQSCSNTSSGYASRVIKDKSKKRRKCNKGSEEENTVFHKELKHFYPLSDKDISNLNFYAEREFSSNFVNQLLLKLYIKYPDKRFKNKFTILSYLQKALKNEKHQGPLVNHTSFRFSCNINEEDKNMQNYEKYLTEIENSFDISKEMQVKKKIAGRYSTRLAYEILTQVDFRTNLDNSFVTALIPGKLDLSEKQREVLSEQLEAVYGKNKYYVDIVEDAEEEVEKGEEQERRGEGEVLSTKTKISGTTTLTELSSLKSKTIKQIDNLSEQLLSEFEKLANLREAIILEQQHLQELYQINETANSLSALLQAQAEQKERFEQEMSQRKQDFEQDINSQKLHWQQQRAALEQDYKEQKELLSKTRKREEEEYNYTLELKRRKELDEYNNKRILIEKELSELKDNLLKREADLATKEQEYVSLKMQVDGMADKIKEAVYTAEELLRNQLLQQYDFEKQLTQKEYNGILQLKEQSIIYLEDKIKKQENTIQELTAKADNATQQVQSIACRALDTSGQRFISLTTNKQEEKG